MRVLAVGDSYMPADYFREAFAELEATHDVEYREVEDAPNFAPRLPSELKIREYLGTPAQVAGWMDEVEVLALHGAAVTERVLQVSPRLQLVCCARGGPVNVDIDALTDRGLPLVHTPGKNAEAVADLTLGFLVMLARGLPRAQEFLLQGNTLENNWAGAQFIGNDLRGRTLGVVGYGQVGRRVTSRALAFGMVIVVYDPYVAAHGEGIRQVTRLQELLACADFVSLHARASATNQHLIDRDALQAMQRGACLVNTAREALVDEEALDAALASGWVGGAALDVFEPSGHRLLRHENVVLTPHIGGATRDTLFRGAEMIASEITRFAAGEPLRNVVHKTGAAR